MGPDRSELGEGLTILPRKIITSQNVIQNLGPRRILWETQATDVSLVLLDSGYGIVANFCEHGSIKGTKFFISWATISSSRALIYGDYKLLYTFTNPMISSA